MIRQCQLLAANILYPLIAWELIPARNVCHTQKVQRNPRGVSRQRHCFLPGISTTFLWDCCGCSVRTIKELSSVFWQWAVSASGVIACAIVPGRRKITEVTERDLGIGVCRYVIVCAPTWVWVAYEVVLAACWKHCVTDCVWGDGKMKHGALSKQAMMQKHWCKVAVSPTV